MDKRPIALYTPFPQPTDNTYLHKNVALLETLGFEVIGEPRGWGKRAKFILKHLFKRDIDTVVLNWHENLFRFRDGRVNYIGIPIYVLSLILFRLMARKLIYVKHNLYPHAFVKPSRRRLATRLMKLGEWIAHESVTHSGHMDSQHYTYIPHPLYEVLNSEKLDAFDIPETLPSNYFLMFGVVEPYKKIDEVIARWTGDTPLVIAGRCKDPIYFEKLRKLAENKKVQFLNRFVSEEEAQKLVRSSRAMILAHADEDMIVSGSFFFGISLDAKLYAIRTPFLNWIASQDSGSATHLFDNLEQLINGLNTETKNDEIDHAFKTRQFGEERILNAWRTTLEV